MCAQLLLLSLGSLAAMEHAALPGVFLRLMKEPRCSSTACFSLADHGLRGAAVFFAFLRRAMDGSDDTSVTPMANTCYV